MNGRILRYVGRLQLTPGGLPDPNPLRLSLSGLGGTKMPLAGPVGEE